MLNLYNSSDKNSILEYAKKLKDKSLLEACGETIHTETYSGKGKFGQLLEKHYFGYTPNSIAEPDFSKAAMELKSSPLKQLKNKEYRSKERIVLNIINYLEVIDQDFDNSSFWSKNAHLLLVFYLHDRDKHAIEYLIKLVDDWTFPPEDLEVIKKDWEAINQKIKSGKAHELSEGDTFYLGACTKGGKGGNPRKQPNNNLLAKQRAYSLKQGYVNHIIASISGQENQTYGKLLPSKEVAKKKTIEEIVLSKFQPNYGKTVDEIIQSLPIILNMKAKGFYANLTKAILDIELDKKIEEFEKADITIKAVRLKENNLPKEDISFPAFKYMELINEEWDTSNFKNLLEHKFLFVFFQLHGNQLVLRKVKFWNMPFQDIEDAKKVWKKTIEVINDGSIVREIKIVKNGKKSRLTNFPNKNFSSVSHVRPHARDADDTYPLPVRDKLTMLDAYTKHCFWLNANYIRDEVYLK